MTNRLGPVQRNHDKMTGSIAMLVVFLPLLAINAFFFRRALTMDPNVDGMVVLTLLLSSMVGVVAGLYLVSKAMISLVTTRRKKKFFRSHYLFRTGTRAPW